MSELVRPDRLAWVSFFQDRMLGKWELIGARSKRFTWPGTRRGNHKCGFRGVRWKRVAATLTPLEFLINPIAGIKSRGWNGVSLFSSIFKARISLLFLPLARPWPSYAATFPYTVRLFSPVAPMKNAGTIFGSRRPWPTSRFECQVHQFFFLLFCILSRAIFI